MLLELIGITKRYGKTLALNGLNLNAHSGQVLGIAGPNGAGKTTMIRILAGEEMSDHGEIRLDGDPWPLKYRKDNVAVVHQEPLVFPNLTVEENLLVGREGRLALRPTASRKQLDLLGKLGIANYARSLLDQCPLLVGQLCEICRALLAEAKIFLFDEPTSFLTKHESARLFEQMASLKKAGRIVLFVTHRLGELVRHADRVVVIRDGSSAFVLAGSDLCEERLAECLVVSEKSAPQKSCSISSKTKRRDSSESREGNHVLLEVSHLSHRYGFFTDVELRITRCEILAIMGVEGSGAREILRALCGLRQAHGSLKLFQGKKVGCDFRKIEYLSASRKTSIFYNLSVGENIVSRLGFPEIASRLGYLRLKMIYSLSSEYITKFRVRVESPFNSIASLSGGNQQKVAVVAAIAKKPIILALEEPTRGVDLQSKAEIYSFIRDFVSRGNAAAVYCTEVPEVFELADHVVVVKEGQVLGQLNVSAFSTAEELAAGIARLEQNSFKETEQRALA